MEFQHLATPIPTIVVRSTMGSAHSFWNKAARLMWSITWLLLFRPSPRILHGWRCFLLRLFRAKIGRGVRIYPSAQVWAPWRLEMGDFSCLGPQVDCYCVAPIRIEAGAVVSQYSYLCSASHDYEQADFPLVTGPIVIAEGAWVAADAFVGMGVTVGAGAVVGARASVFKDVEPGAVVGGNPARFIKKRVMRTA